MCGESYCNDTACKPPFHAVGVIISQSALRVRQDTSPATNDTSAAPPLQPCCSSHVIHVIILVMPVYTPSSALRYAPPQLAASRTSALTATHACHALDEHRLQSPAVLHLQISCRSPTSASKHGPAGIWRSATA